MRAGDGVRKSASGPDRETTTLQFSYRSNDGNVVANSEFTVTELYSGVSLLSLLLPFIIPHSQTDDIMSNTPSGLFFLKPPSNLTNFLIMLTIYFIDCLTVSTSEVKIWIY